MLVEFKDSRVTILCAEEPAWITIRTKEFEMNCGYGEVKSLKNGFIDIKTRDDKRYSLRVKGDNIKIVRKDERTDINFGRS